MSTTTTGFDKQAAITRSLLGWGVVAGPFYIVVGLILALTRPGFDVSRHALSLLTLGEYGWMQRANLILSGLMVIAAAFGILRAIRNGRGLATGVLVAIYGAGMVLGGVFVPDPVAGFPRVLRLRRASAASCTSFSPAWEFCRSVPQRSPSPDGRDLSLSPPHHACRSPRVWS